MLVCSSILFSSPAFSETSPDTILGMSLKECRPECLKLLTQHIRKLYPPDTPEDLLVNKLKDEGFKINVHHIKGDSMSAERFFKQMERSRPGACGDQIISWEITKDWETVKDRRIGMVYVTVPYVLPPILQGFDMKGCPWSLSEPLKKRLQETYPVGSSQEKLREDLISQGFEKSKYREGEKGFNDYRFYLSTGGGCSTWWGVDWIADELGKIISTNARYWSVCS